MIKEQIAHDLAWLENPVTDLVTTLPPYSPFIAHRHGRHSTTNPDNENPNLHRYFAMTYPRLGHYFEALVAAWICHHLTLHANTPRLFKQGIKLFEEGESGRRTRGELDFIFDTATGITHLEVAVKFYLAYFNDNHWTWLGPDVKDSLHTKLTRLQTHQLPLSNDYSVNGRAIANRQFWVKGALFVPWSHPQPALPANINPLMCENIWLHHAQLPDFLKAQGQQWQVCEKLQWLSGPVNFSAMPLNLNDVSADYPRMLMCAHPKDIQRVMVVPDNWPNIKRENKA